jgi:hypothetical protein
MEQQSIFNAERYLTKDFLYIQTSKENEISNRTIDFNTMGIVRATLSAGISGSTKPGAGGWTNGLRRLVGTVVSGEFSITPNVTTPGSSIDIGLVSGAPTTTFFTGLAYDGLGNRIAIYQNQIYQSTNTMTNPIPGGLPTNITMSSGNVSIPMSVGDNYIWIAYLQITDLTKNSISVDEFGVVHFSRLANGYQVAVTTTNVPPTPGGATAWVLLGRVVGWSATWYTNPVVDLTQVTYCNHRAEDVEAIIDSADLVPTAYVDKSVVSAQDHFNALGNGTLISVSNPHRQIAGDIGAASIVDLVTHRNEQHDPGLIANATRTSTASALYPKILGTQVYIAPLAPSGEEAYTQGQRIYSPTSMSTASFTDGVNTFTFISVGGQYVFDFLDSWVTPPATGYYIFYLTALGTGTGNITAQYVNAAVSPYAGQPPAAVYSAIETLENSGNLVIAAVKWNSSLVKLFGITQAFTDTAAPMDLRGFGSDGSKDIEPADGVTGQDVTVGFGVKTNHIQDNAVEAGKLAFSARNANMAVIGYKDAQHVWIPNTNGLLTGSFGYTMDGFYSQWLGGYVKVGSNGVYATNQGSQFRLNNSAQPSAQLAVDMDSGSSVTTDNWYEVVAVEQRNTTNPSFGLKFVTFIKVGSYTGGLIVPTQHAWTGGSVVTPAYGWNVNDYAGTQALVLTGAYAGYIFTIDSNTSNTLTSSSAPTLNPADYIMLAPALALGNGGNYNPVNFRYLGAIYVTATSIIRPFEKIKDANYFAPLSTSPSTGTLELDSIGGVSWVPPTAVSIGGQLNVSTTSNVGLHLNGGSPPSVNVNDVSLPVAGSITIDPNSLSGVQGAYVSSTFVGYGASSDVSENVYWKFGIGVTINTPFPETPLTQPNIVHVTIPSGGTISITEWKE